MLYLANDQHRKQLTVNLRNEAGDVILKRQVSTEWARVREFLVEVRERSVPEGGFVAIVEVCGFNDWLLKLLAEYGCREVIVIQPEKRSKKKTDRRDANALGELLWVNRQRLLAGQGKGQGKGVRNHCFGISCGDGRGGGRPSPDRSASPFHARILPKRLPTRQ